MTMSDFLARFCYAPNRTPGTGGGTPSPSPAAAPSTDGGGKGESDTGSDTGSGTEGDSNGDDFSDIAEYYERGEEQDPRELDQPPEDESGDEGGDEKSKPSEQPATPTPDKQEATPPDQAPKPDPAQQPTPPEQQPAAQQPEHQPAQQQLTAEQWQQQLTQWHDQAVDVLSQQVYTISDEEAQLLQTEPEKVLPKMAARVHVQAMQAAMVKTLEFVPRIIEQYMQTHTKKSAFETEFYQKWPKLRDADQNRIGQVAAAYVNSLNGRRPSRVELIDEVGQLAHAMLHIPLDQPAQQQPTQPPASQHFQPAAATGRAPARQPAPRSEFELIAESIENGDLDL